MKMRTLGILAAAVASGLLSAANPARANSVSFSTVADGSSAATVEFTAVAGGIDITLTNTQTGTIVKAQAISALNFTVSGLSAPTAFTELKGEYGSPAAGSTWTGGTAFGPSPTPIDHWALGVSGLDVALATAGGPSSGKPQYMILPSSGKAGTASSLDDSHAPYLIGPTDFYITVPGVTASTVFTASEFTKIKIGFGTGPDSTLGIVTPPVNPVPLPAAVWSGFSLLACLGLFQMVRKVAR